MKISQIFQQIDRDKTYGYKININKPEYREAYNRFKAWKHIPKWCPLSDEERHEFERYIFEVEKKKK